MNNLRFFKSGKFISRICYPRYYISCSKINRYSLYPSKTSRSSYLNVIKSAKYISNCSSMQTKDSDSPNSGKGRENMQKILEDNEFQSILKDFASDFGVDKETNDLLDDIRKNINGDYKESNETHNKHIDKSSEALGGGLDLKYKEFSDSDSTVIPSFEEGYDTFEDERPVFHIDQELQSKFSYCNLKRGVTGVFDIDDIVQVLRNESLLDITTISMLTDDNECSTDFFVLVTAKSPRHCAAVAESIKKLYKKKKNKNDPFVTVEGAENSGWRIIDMGNIVLHIFLEGIRAKYDIESCQLFDLQFDSGGNIQPDPMLNIIEEQMEFFNSLQQSSSPNSPEESKDIS